MRNRTSLYTLLLSVMCLHMAPAYAQTGLSEGMAAQPIGTPEVEDGAITLEPSPFDRELNVRFHSLPARGTVVIDLVNLRNGQVMLTRTTSPRVGIQFNTSDLEQGRYMVVVTETISGRVLARLNASRVVNDDVSPNVNELSLDGRSDNELMGDTKSMLRNSFLAYPNPFSDHINVRFDIRKVQQPVEVALRSTQSGEIALKIIADPRQEAAMGTSHIPAGAYVLEVRDQEQGFLIGTLQMKK